MTEPSKSRRIESVLDLCDASPWSRVLFTSFTFSPSFFDAYVLPKLEAVGCREITVLVDKSFYLNSLVERQARWIGKSYRLIGVSCPNVFHPKLTYFWGPDEDVVTVGSGNLTYAGHGEQLECLDFLSSIRDAASFPDVEGFFDALITSSSIDRGGADQILSRFKSRAGSVARRDGSIKERPLLIHSIGRSVEAQVQDHLTILAPLKRIVSAAPFHNPKAAPLVRLAKKLRCKDIDVCVNPDGSLAPFKKKALEQEGLAVRFVRPDPSQTRSLHAKWYEFHGDRKWLLTGSVNATEASFSSTENVEVAILRRASKATVSWAVTTPKGVSEPQIRVGVSQYQGWLFAFAMDDGRVEAEIHGIKAPAGKWTATAATHLERFELGWVEVQASGALQLRLPPDAIDGETSVQLILKRSKEQVAGWVSFQSMLDAPPEARGARLALNRLSRNDALKGDIQRVVNWLMEFIHEEAEARPLAPAPGKAGSPEKKQVKAERRITYEEWSTSDARDSSTRQGVSDVVRRALTALARSNTQRGASPRGEDPRTRKRDAAFDPPPPEEFDLVSELDSAIHHFLQDHPNIPIAVDLALFRADFGLRTSIANGGLAGLAGRALAWVRWSIDLEWTNAQLTHIGPAILAMATASVLYSEEAQRHGLAAELRERIEKRWGRLSIEKLQELAARGMAMGQLSLIAQADKTKFAETLSTIMSTQSPRAALQAFLEHIRAGERVKPPDAVRQYIGEAATRALLDHVHDQHRKFGEIKSPQDETGCPNAGCYARLTDAERTELRGRRAIRCTGCGRAIVWLGTE